MIPHKRFKSFSSQRDRLLALAAGGCAFSLCVIFLCVMAFKGEAEATAPTEFTASPHSYDVIEVPVLERDTRATSSLSTARVRYAYWQRDSLPTGVVRDPSELEGMYAKHPIRAGELIQRSALTRERLYGEPLPEIGMRKIAIQLEATDALDLHIGPGSLVDVVEISNIGGIEGKVLVQRARVLSLGGDSRPSNDDPRAPKRLLRNTAALEVTKQDALMLATVSRTSRLTLLGCPEQPDPFQDPTYKPRAAIPSTGRNSRACDKGTMRMGNQEYLLCSDGEIVPVLSSQEP
ncbi:MAG: Flp pilus assembly protein CpaB [Bdellovibrionales bacterium]|nr:Flp pilus assembly protein CpaB [Bdellovibrionales bacterium]